MTPGGPPVLVLGVRRSGTTLLRVMLDRHSELAVPDESYFVPQLADRHLRRVDPDAFVDDLRRIDTLAEWNVPLDKVRARLRMGMPIGAAIATVYAVYAEERGKARWGDKTPMYMQNLRLLERLFPDALFVHLIRDGRDAAHLVSLDAEGLDDGDLDAARERRRVRLSVASRGKAARRLGWRVGGSRYLEVRYEELVQDVETVLRRISTFALLPYEPAMVDYVGNVDVAARRSRTSRASSVLRPRACATGGCRCPLRTSGHSSGSPETSSESSATSRTSGPDPRGRLRRASYNARAAAWRAASFGLRRSPLWRRRHPPLR